VKSLFDIERYSTVWQMTSNVCARTAARLEQILCATFPPASITGAPKRRAMQIIAELESSPRRVYTGTIGFIAPGRHAQFNVAIRTVLIERTTGAAEYGVGGGIVWDSKADDERQECLTKAKLLSPVRQDFDLLETLLWSPAQDYWLLEYHLKRLAQSAEYFGFQVDVTAIRERLHSISSEWRSGERRIRLVVSRHGAVNYQEARLEPAAMRFEDISLATAPIDAGDVFLYHKTTRRSAYKQALVACPGQKDVLLFNDAGEITESTVANVAFEMESTLWTPPLRCGLLPGTCRAWLLEQGRIRERVVSIEQARGATAVYLLNSIRGMQNVRGLEGPIHECREGAGTSPSPCRQ
jgi:para-aminobenzoate synthetase/4-amino-4-deoxychorismate lyase